MLLEFISPKAGHFKTVFNWGESIPWSHPAVRLWRGLRSCFSYLVPGQCSPRVLQNCSPGGAWRPARRTVCVPTHIAQVCSSVLSSTVDVNMCICWRMALRLLWCRIEVFYLFFSFFLDPIWILVVAPVTLFLFVFLIFLYWHMKKNPCKRKSITLPKSLVIYLIIYLIMHANIDLNLLWQSLWY